MINLLPAKDQIFIKREYSRRLSVVVGVLVFVIVFGAIILLYPSYFLLLSQEKIFGKQLSDIKRGVNEDSARKIEAIVGEFNEELIAINNKKADSLKVRNLLKQLLEAKPSTIHLTNLSYRRDAGGKQKTERVVLNGEAEDRNFLLSFIRAIEKIDGVEKVDSPVANLLKNENIDFSMSIDLIQQDNN